MRKTAKELEREFQKSNEWNPELLNELAKLADMEDEWKVADGETFETVAEEMAKKVGINLYGNPPKPRVCRRNDHGSNR
ncbi:MAG: hypothetical protein KGZ53_02760 [Peptococcaceae bacterium]|nr:hypothetical protein [Peptococcaceae bacterium]